MKTFDESQWWFKELEAAVAQGTSDQRRAIAVVRQLLAQQVAPEVGEPDLALFSRLLPGLNAMIRGKPSHAFRAFQIGRFAGAVAAEHDASRWKALRAMHWHDSPFAVVRNPKQQVKLGTDCPSGDRLDELMDAFIVSQAKP